MCFCPIFLQTHACPCTHLFFRLKHTCFGNTWTLRCKPAQMWIFHLIWAMRRSKPSNAPMNCSFLTNRIQSLILLKRLNYSYCIQQWHVVFSFSDSFGTTACNLSLFCCFMNWSVVMLPGAPGATELGMAKLFYGEMPNALCIPKNILPSRRASSCGLWVCFASPANSSFICSFCFGSSIFLVFQKNFSTSDEQRALYPISLKEIRKSWNPSFMSFLYKWL